MSKEKNEQKENEKNEPMINLLYTFKKNITSQDPFYPLNNLTTRNVLYGWQSSRFCTYPQVLIVEFYSYVNIKQINILLHEKKIPTMIEFVNCLPKNISALKAESPRNNNTNKSNDLYYTNKKIGFIRLSPNIESNYKSRELRKIHVDIYTKRLKLIIHKNYSNSYNIFCQVGIISLNFLGYILPEETNEENNKLNYSELYLEEDIDDIDDNILIQKMDEDAKIKLQQLLNELQEKKNNEEYDKCIVIQNKIDQLKKISFKIYQLENYKNQCSLNNDFEKSIKIKNNIDILKQKLNNEFDIENNNNNSNNNNSINKFNTINHDLVLQTNSNNNNNNTNNYYYNNEENMFSRRIKKNNDIKNVNNLKLSKSQPDLFNSSENKHDDIVLPAIQRKMNANLSTINVNNNSSNSFEINNSNNSSAVLDLIRDKNENINLKDLPPPEEITDKMKTKFKMLLDVFGEEIFKKIFSKIIEYKVLGLQELNNEVTQKIIEIPGTTQEANKYIVSLINIFFLFLDDRRPSLVSESLQLFINVLKGIKERSNSNKTEYDFKITKRLLNKIRGKLNHISKKVRTKAEELYSYMLISDFCEYYPIITELVESDVDNFYKKIGITDKADLNIAKCSYNIKSKGGMSNIKIDVSKELIVTKMNIFYKIFSDIENNKENKVLNEKNFPKEIVGDFIIINIDHPKKEVRLISKKVLCLYIHIFGKDIFFKLRLFIDSKELIKLFQDSPELLKIYNDIRDEEKKKLQEIKMNKFKNYLEKKLNFKGNMNQNKTINDSNSLNIYFKKNKLNHFDNTFDKNNLSSINEIKSTKNLNINPNSKPGKILKKSASQPDYKSLNKVKLKPINYKVDFNKMILEEVQIKKMLDKKKKVKVKNNSVEKSDVSKIQENEKVN